MAESKNTYVSLLKEHQELCEKVCKLHTLAQAYVHTVIPDVSNVTLSMSVFFLFKAEREGIRADSLDDEVIELVSVLHLV